MKNNYKILKTKEDEMTFVNKHILLGETHYPFLRKYHNSHTFKNDTRTRKYKDLSKIKYDEDCGE